MRFRNFFGVALLVLCTASVVGAQNGQAAGPTGGVGGAPQQGGPAPLPYSGQPGNYDNAAPPPGVYQDQSAPGYSDMNSPDWPSYPYSQYHNPYYEGAAARDVISGTLDWVMGLPSNVFDRVSNFLDGHVFPQAPATHGSSKQAQPPQANDTGQRVLPSAMPNAEPR